MSAWDRLACWLRSRPSAPACHDAEDYRPDDDDLVLALRAQAAKARRQTRALHTARVEQRAPTWEELFGVREPARERGRR